VVMLTGSAAVIITVRHQVKVNIEV